MNQSKEPFWKDLPDRQIGNRQPGKVWSWLSYGTSILRLMGTIFITGIALYALYRVSHILAWILLVIVLLLFGILAYLVKSLKSKRSDIPQIQENAQRQAGASVIGSAIHVAGHPLLNREQEVVLALTSEGLKIFSYEDGHPLDILSVNHITELHTVTYDDERIPHIEVINSTAQALQFTYKVDGKEYTCLFRRMRKVRPIDWYHELQKARFGDNSISS